MPNRILRDWTDSETIDRLSVNAERFFTRLIMKVDDYGRYNANVKLLKSTLFPLKTDVREADISLWLTECEKCGLVALYDVAQKGYLQIENFKQQLRQKTEKYPAPESCNADDKQMHSTRIADASLKGYESKRNEVETKGGQIAPLDVSNSEIVLEPEEILRRIIEQEYKIKEYVMREWKFTEDQFNDIAREFVTGKSAGVNDLAKAYPEVLRHFRNWVKNNAERLKRKLALDKPTASTYSPPKTILK